VDPAGVWSWAATGLSEGANALAFAQSLAGHTDSAEAVIQITVDTIAPAAPAVFDTLSAAGTARPEFAGTAEPGSTAAVSTPGDAVLIAVAADSAGHWATGPVAGLEPSTTMLKATQTDLAGNESPSAVIGPFAFVPGFAEPLD